MQMCAPSLCRGSSQIYRYKGGESRILSEIYFGHVLHFRGLTILTIVFTGDKRGLAKLKSNISFCHETHSCLGQIRRVGNSEAKHRKWTTLRTSWNPVHARHHYQYAYKLEWRILRGSLRRNKLWDHFVVTFYGKTKFWKHLRPLNVFLHHQY